VLNSIECSLRTLEIDHFLYSTHLDTDTHKVLFVHFSLFDDLRSFRLILSDYDSILLDCLIDTYHSWKVTVKLGRQIKR